MATAKQTRPWVTCALAGSLSAFGLAGSAAPAAAAPAPAPSYHWCPGDQWDPAWGTNYDTNHCHDWLGAGGEAQGGPAGWGPWGPPPPWAPPQPPPPPWAPTAHVMWNPTVGWGFWNNGIWTPI